MAENVTNLPIYCTARIPEFFFLKHRELPGYFTFVSPIPFTEPKINHSVWSLAPRPASQTVCVKILLKDRTTYHFNIYFFPSKPKSSITIKQAGSVRRFKAQWIILHFFFFFNRGPVHPVWQQVPSVCGASGEGWADDHRTHVRKKSFQIQSETSKPTKPRIVI